MMFYVLIWWCRIKTTVCQHYLWCPPQETVSRLLQKNYSLLVSMAPLTHELRALQNHHPATLGPSLPGMPLLFNACYCFFFGDWTKVKPSHHPATLGDPVCQVCR